MRSNNSSDIVFYLFWGCMLLLGSIAAVFILSRMAPEYMLKRIDTQTNIIQEPTSNTRISAEIITAPIVEQAAKIVDSTENTAIESNSNPPATTQVSITPKPSVKSKDTDSKLVAINSSSLNLKKNNDFKINTPFSLFRNGVISSIGKFTNYKGTTFVAGILNFEGKYPQEFENISEIFSNNQSIPLVNIELAFGWQGLPNFSEINKLNTDNRSDVQLQLPRIQVLNLKIEITKSLDNDYTTKIEKSVSDYIYSLFDKELLPREIIHLAQQRLASAYIKNNHSRIKLVP